MGRIRFRKPPIPELPPAWAALVVALREDIEASRFDSLDQLGAALYGRPASSERRDGRRISEWARGAEFPPRDDLATLIQLCHPNGWARVGPLYAAATAERTTPPPDTTPGPGAGSTAGPQGATVTVVSAPGGVAAQEIIAGRDITVDQSISTIHQHAALTPAPPVVRVGGVVRYANPAMRVLGPAVLAGVLAAAVVAVTAIMSAASAGWTVAAGAVVGVVVGALVWVVLSLRHARTQELRQTRAAVLEPLRSVAALLPGEHTLSTLLAPQQALTRLQGRDREKTQLLAWVVDLSGSPVRILAGPSGVGKTRLAVEVARELPQGWVAGRCASGRAGQVLAAVRACGDPTLVVIDDADTEPGIRTLIQEITADPDPAHPDTTRVKVLLVVRDGPAYNRWLQQHLDGALARNWPVTELEVNGGAGDRRRWFVAAARAYATALGMAPPAVSDTDGRPVGVDGEPMVLTQARAVLAARGGTPTRVDAARTAGLNELAAELVAHERQRWNRTATDPRWSLHPEITTETRAEAVLALALCAPTSTAEAVAVLRRLPALGGVAEIGLRNLVSWAWHLYPGPSPALLDPTPDFLAGALLAELTRPAHAELLTDLDLTTTAADDPQLIDRLVRAAATFPTVRTLITWVLTAAPGTVVTAVESLILVGQSARTVQPLLVMALSAHELSATDATRLLQLIGDLDWPALRVALQHVIVTDARQHFDNEPSDTTCATLARALYNLSVGLYEVGEHRRALTAAEEAVQLRRELADAEPARYTPDLAIALTNLGNHLGTVGEHRRALTAAEEAIQLHRELADAEPARHTPDLATSLNNLGNELHEVGEYRRALTAAEEAVQLRRELADAEPARHTPDLAIALHNLGNHLGAVGEYRRALTAAEEAVQLRRELVTAKPARYTPDLAMALTSLSNRLDQVGEHRRALTAAEEAVQLRRELADAEPARYTPDLAIALTNLGNHLGTVGEHRRALTAAEEAIQLHRELTDAEPARHTPDLAAALNNLGAQLYGVGEHRRALTAAEEAVQLRRELADAEPARHTPDLAMALTNLGAHLGAVGEHGRALTASEEAVQLYRELTAAEPARHTPNLAAAVKNLGVILERQDEPGEQLQARAEAVAWWRRLAQQRPERRDTYLRERANLAKLFTDQGFDVGAAIAAEDNALVDVQRLVDHVDAAADVPPADSPDSGESGIR